MRHADRVIAVSESLAQELQREFPDRAGRVRYIPNGVPASSSPAPDVAAKLGRFGLQPDGYILSVGRLVPEKGFDDLIDAHARSVTRLPLVIVGITLVKGFEQNIDLKMAPGQTATLAGYTFRFDGAFAHEGPNYDAARGRIEMTRDGRSVAMMYPEKRMYRVSQMPMTEAAIDSGITRDIYVSMGEPLPDGSAWIVRIFYKPFINWIWIGALIMAFGGVLAAADRRYRKLAQRDGKQPAEAPAPAVKPGPAQEQHA
ncbi:MAG: hypothetical protein B7Z51_00380 [Methyloversatilis sp. 12-65-5]|nr:MAG: hypothetical protein B7Z51_00380 [Methyloversatilis sp. 12-65-5]